MENTIKLTIPFSFKGQNYQPSVIVDLDAFTQQEFDMQSMLPQLARENNIGNYSYEFEILESSAWVFSDATGLAENYLDGEQFDLEGFRQALKENQILQQLQSIAKETLGVADLNSDVKLKNALQQAFEAGQSLKNH